MGTFETSTLISAELTAVWDTLADIGNIAHWNPGVQASHLTSETQSEGVGACRHCNLGGNNYLDETVVKWEPEKALTMRITSTNLPFKTADIRFRLTPQTSGTKITVSPIYELKFGPLGKLLDAVYVKNNYQKGMDALLAGLKKHLEN